MNEVEAIQFAEKKLPDKRFKHSLRVAETAKAIAKMFNGNEHNVNIAGILHDVCKYDDLNIMYQHVVEYNLDQNLLLFGSEVLHGPIAALLLKENFNLNDDIIHAIENHTCGNKEMTLTEKIIYIADYIEPNRKQPGVENIRTIVFENKDLDLAVYEITKSNMLYLLENNQIIYKKTLDCLNYYNFLKE